MGEGTRTRLRFLHSPGASKTPWARQERAEAGPPAGAFLSAVSPTFPCLHGRSGVVGWGCVRVSASAHPPPRPRDRLGPLRGALSLGGPIPFEPRCRVDFYWVSDPPRRHPFFFFSPLFFHFAVPAASGLLFPSSPALAERAGAASLKGRPSAALLRPASPSRWALWPRRRLPPARGWSQLGRLHSFAAARFPPRVFAVTLEK